MDRGPAARLLVTLAFVLPLGFAAFTAHAWEDYFITLRATRNLVEGNGLVFTPGERVHSFTSPLGTLLPALCTALTGPGQEEFALWLYRVINAGVLAAGALLLWRRFDALHIGAIGRTVTFGLILADAKLTDFAINGMETALLAYFVVLLWTELTSPAGPRTAVLASSYAGLMWTRPDAFILAGAITLPHLVFSGRDRSPALSWRRVIPGVLLGGAMYAPWFAWAWWYYGSPVPHTVTAKSAFAPPIHLTHLLELPLRALIGRSPLADLFLPAYWIFGGWPAVLPKIAHILSVVAAFGWLLPNLNVFARRLSLTLFTGLFYLGSITLYPWYLPPWLVLAAIMLGLSADQLYDHVKTSASALASVVRIAAASLVVLHAGLWVAVAWQMRTQQRLIENGVRRQIGEWLHTQADPKDTLFLEPLGYIGYFSRMKTYDFPGLSSPEVVRAVRAGAGNYVMIIEQLRPDWLVLRPYELAEPQFKGSDILHRYNLVRVFSARRDLDQIRFLPGRRWNEWESEYYVYRRQPEASVTP